MQFYDAFFQSAIFRNILYNILCLEGLVGFKIEDDFVYLSTEGFSCHNINETLRLLKNIKIHKMYKKLILEFSQFIFNNKNTLFFFLFLLLTKYDFNSFTVKVLLVYIVYISIKVYIFSSKNHQNSSANQLLSVLYILYCVRNYRLTYNFRVAASKPKVDFISTLKVNCPQK